MSTKIQPFLMFEGRAEEAMNFYVSLFPDAKISDVTHWGPGQPGKEGSFQKASLSIGGQTVIFVDNPVKHVVLFTPSFSLFVTCESEAELRRLFSTLSDGGGVL